MRASVGSLVYKRYHLTMLDVEKIKTLAINGFWDEINSIIESNLGVIHHENGFGDNLLIILSGFPGSLPCLEKLVQLGADVDSISMDGVSPIEATILAGRKINLHALPELRFLLESGASIITYGTGGNPPLHWAIYHNRLEEARLLLEYGAKIDQKNIDEETALDIANEAKNREALDLLREFIE